MRRALRGRVTAEQESVLKVLRDLTRGYGIGA